jgi:hypothetical protein
MEVQVRTEVTGEMIMNRNRLQREINQHKPFVDRDVFKKTRSEKQQISIEKSKWKANISNGVYQGKRDELISAFLENLKRRIPSWGIGSGIDFS